MSSDLRQFILAMTRVASASADLYKSVVEFNMYADSLTDELQLVSKDIYTTERQQTVITPGRQREQDLQTKKDLSMAQKKIDKMKRELDQMQKK